MKKLLSATLALTMGVTCVVGFTACGNKKGGGKSDKELAESAIETVISYHADDAVENNANYKVLGKTKVDGTMYDVSWSVSSATFNDLNNYVKVGTELDTSNKYTVSVTLADTVIEYKLTASVTVGKETASHSFDKKVSKKAADAAGTEEDAFSVAKVLEIGSTLEAGKFYTGSDGKPAKVYVEGYVVDTGTQYDPSRISNVYIVDEYSDSKTKDDGLVIYSITYDNTHLQRQGDIAKGNKIKVAGFIQNYLNNNKTTLEITYLKAGTAGNAEDISVVCVSNTDARTDAQKLTASVAKLGDVNVNKAGDYELPVPWVSAVKFEWSTTDTTYTISEDGKHLKVDALPTAGPATVELKVKATCGTATPVEQTITATIKKAEQLASGEVALDLAFETTQADWSNSYAAHELSFADAGASVDGTISFSRVSKQTGTSAITAVPVIAANATATGNNHAPTVYVTVALGSGTLKTAEFSLENWAASKKFSDIHIEYFNGESWVKCSEVLSGSIAESANAIVKLASNTDIPEGVQYVRLSISTTSTSNTQVGLSAIKLATDPNGTSSLEPPKGDEEGDNSGSTPENPPAATGTFTAITAPAAGTYKFAMNAAGTLYFFSGSVSGTYLATTTDASKASDVTVVADGDGWLLKVGDKFLELVSETGTNGKTYLNPKLNDAQTSGKHWTWNDTYKIFVWTDGSTDYFMGTYTNNNNVTRDTMGSSATTYLSGDNASKQYAAQLGTYSAG